MANLTGKLDELQSKIKKELAIFLANQSVLLSLRNPLEALKSAQPAVYAQLKTTYGTLYSRQASIESKAIDWMKRIAELKDAILADPNIAGALSTGTISPAMFSKEFWVQVTDFTNRGLALVNEGLGLSSMLVTQNGDVALLKKSVEQRTVLVPTPKTMAVNQGLLWAYGLLGLGFAYLVASGKRETARR